MLNLGCRDEHGGNQKLARFEFMGVSSRRIVLAVVLMQYGPFLGLINAQGWTPTSSPVLVWQSIASSADGRLLLAAPSTGPLYISTNSGGTWVQSGAPVTNWSSVASSADGSTLVAAAAVSIYISTDAGGNWGLANVSSSIGGNWISVACSADGKIILTGNAAISGEAYGSEVFVSTNAGASWAGNRLPEFLNCVTMSADGIRMAAVFNAAAGGDIMVSTNMGNSWAYTTAPIRPWGSVASSSDGTKLVATAGRVYLSDDSGDTWLEATNLENQITNSSAFAISSAMSSDGSRVILAYNGYFAGPIFQSDDLGVTWTQTDAPVAHWFPLACSADGFRIAAANGSNWSLNGTNAGPIYISQTTPQPQLAIKPLQDTLLLSWRVPSITFVLHQAPDLTSGKWTPVPVTPSLNYSNLQYQVSIPRPQGTTFYRLTSQ